MSETDNMLNNRLNTMYSQVGETVLRHAMVKLLGNEVGGMTSKHEVEQTVKASIQRGLAAWCDENIVPALQAKLEEHKGAIIDGATMALEQVVEHLKQAAIEQVTEIIKDPKYSKSALSTVLGLGYR